jgi:hypothetical protein
MLAKCLNAGCDAKFRYLNQGRIFNIEIPFAKTNGERSFLKAECFWLCENCSQTMKVIVDNGTVTTAPLDPAEIISSQEEREQISIK